MLQCIVEELFQACRLLSYGDKEQIARPLYRLHDLFFVLARLGSISLAVLVFWYGLGGLVVSLVGLLCLDSSSSSFSSWSAVTWSLALAQSVLGMAGVCCLYTALTFTSPTSVMIIRSEEIVLSYIIQVTAFGSSLHLLDFLGAFFIVFSVLAIGLESLVSGKLAQCCSSSTAKLDDVI